MEFFMYKYAYITATQNSITKCHKKTLSYVCFGSTEERSLLIWMIREGCFVVLWEEVKRIVFKDGGDFK